MNQTVQVSSLVGREASNPKPTLGGFRLRASACAYPKSNANHFSGKLNSLSYSAFEHAGNQNVLTVTMHLLGKIRVIGNDVLMSKVSEECDG